MREMMTMTDAASYLCMTEGAWHKAIQHGSVPYRRHGKRILFRKADLDAWFDQLPGTSVKAALSRVVKAEPVVTPEGNVSLEMSASPRLTSNDDGSSAVPFPSVRRPVEPLPRRPGRPKAPR